MILPTAGQLDRRIVIQRQAAGTDDHGQANGAWSTHLTLWARFRPVSDGERMRAGHVEAYAEARFVTRWSDSAAGVTERDRISWGGDSWQIVGIKEMGRREWLELSAVRTDAAG